MHTSTKYGAAISVTALILIALVSTLIQTEQIHSRHAIPPVILALEGGENTVIVLPPVGEGKTEPASGNYTVEADTNFKVKADADPGWYFDLWTISSLNMSGKETSTNYSMVNPLTIQCGQKSVYYLQAVFRNSAAADSLPFGFAATTAIAFLVTVAIVEAAVLGFLYVRKGRK